MTSARSRRTRIFVVVAAAATFGATLASSGQAHARPAAPQPAVRPSEAVLSGISCPQLSTCWAVGYRGQNPSVGGTLAMRWSERHQAWQRVPTPNPGVASESSFNGVSCPTATSCMAVGAAETAPPSLKVAGLTEHWNGHHWSIKSLPTPHRYPSSNLWAVSCPARRDCIAVGSYVPHPPAGSSKVLIEQWDGSAWSVMTAPSGLPSSDLFGVSCASSTSCFAVGDYGNGIGRALTLVWNGTMWSQVRPRAGINSQSVQLDGVSCADSTDCLSVGRYDENTSTSLERTIAETWQAPLVTFTRSRNPSSVNAAELWSDSCTSSTYCLAAGQAETNSSGTHMKTLIERWNGSTWKIIATPADGTSKSFRFLAISCVNATDCFAVGDNAQHSPNLTTLAERWNGHHWRAVAS
jgi:hypothetical protein